MGRGDADDPLRLTLVVGLPARDVLKEMGVAFVQVVSLGYWGGSWLVVRRWPLIADVDPISPITQVATYMLLPVSQRSADGGSWSAVLLVLPDQ